MMNQIVTPIRDITKIEELLTSAYAGVFAFHSNKEQLIQIPCTFLYYHKNVYVALHETEDILEKIVYESNVSFSVLHSEKPRALKSDEFKHVYKIFSTTLTCILKRAEEVKITEEIKNLYHLKYTGKQKNDEEEQEIFFLMLDTVEIKAFEEVGG
jgi:hypothetical protein